MTANVAAENCASAISCGMGVEVEVAANRRAALAALRRREYSVLVVDDSVVEADPAGSEALWQQAGLAIPVQVMFGISGPDRVLREVKAAVQRREREMSVAMRAVIQVMEGEMSTTLTGLLLQVQLALAEPAIPANVAARLRQIMELADVLRARLRQKP